MPKLNEQQLHELIYIKDWCLTILDYMALAYKDAKAPKIFRTIAVEQYEKQNLKGFKHFLKDINEMAKAGSSADIENINKLLRDRFGKDLDDESDNARKKTQTILKRGKINNQDEYRLLISRADEIYLDENFVNELYAINRLLLEYDVKEN